MKSLKSAYHPNEKEEYMNPNQLNYFKEKLLNWKGELVKEIENTMIELKETSLNSADINDRATSETDQALDLRTKDRARKLIKKINTALDRIKDGTYGYCEETGEPIGIKRLEARPIATLCIEAQERHERKEKISNNDILTNLK